MFYASNVLWNLHMIVALTYNMTNKGLLSIPV